MTRAAVPALALLAVAWPAVAASPPPVASPGDLLPDLRQEAPSEIGVQRVHGRWLLGFRSAVQNVGQGPLVISGSRARRARRDMRADQLVARVDGSVRSLAGVGFVRYVTSPDHSHWHFLPFERYELHRPGSDVRLVRDRKSGFCLGDRYRAEPRPANAVPVPVFTTNCGLRNPLRLTIREGISVGWGDDYGAYLDSQHIDITGLPPGRYVLVHTVNAAGRLLEASSANNVATALIVLNRRGARVRVRVLSRTAPPA